MAFPASNFVEKTYRNSIVDVANYFNEYHKNNYLIINVSSRSYDYNNFNGRVKDYDWPDHQAPPLTTLIEISHEIKHFLESN
jgi:phosphatidylinositol-3,4,5-trisphosphate 3-phosphatase/dual-specificity protein phosphatase PTEN